jgi:hypothetical protein
MTQKRKSHDENPFTYELATSEHLLWMGRPDPGKIFSAQDVFQIPFSLLWGGFALMWNASVWVGNAPIFFRLWGLPFLLMGLYMIVGRFIYKAWRKSRTYYAVTDKRLLILSMGLRYNLQAFPIDQLPTLRKQVNRVGAGGVIFGEPPQQNRWQRKPMNMSNTGMEWAGFALDGFYDIPDANEVYALINELRYGDAEKAKGRPVERPMSLPEL